MDKQWLSAPVAKPRLGQEVENNPIALSDLARQENRRLCTSAVFS
jgi:hypothetical protein